LEFESQKRQASLKSPKNVLKTTKEFVNLVDGMKSVDGLLHLKFKWKVVVLNLSGLILFTINCMSIAEMFKFADFTALKTSLAAIPLLGVLPFGGILHTSLFGLFGSLFLLTLDKKKKLAEAENRIVNEKLSFWKEPLLKERIELRLAKYENKISELEDQSAKNPEFQKWIIKRDQWQRLGSCNLNAKEIHFYQKAKLNKWQAKLDKLEREKKINSLSLVNNVISLARQILFVGTTFSGYKSEAISLVKLGLSLVSTGCSLINYFSKQAVNQMKHRAIRIEV